MRPGCFMTDWGHGTGGLGFRILGGGESMQGFEVFGIHRALCAWRIWRLGKPGLKVGDFT